MSILVLGADGYLGWALTCRLAATVGEPIIAVDDLSKRRRVRERDSESAIPILSFDARMALLRQVTARTDLAGIEAGVLDCVEELVREHRPRAIVHLAQIPSAPFSMMSLAAARETIENNEVGNMAVLFAIRDHSPATHLVKMGSMGEYLGCGVPLGEGDVEAVLDGEPASCRIPFPRSADDVYHITKINDTNFIAMACRVWGLASTDVMQSIVYGTRTALWLKDPRLATRFDCDPVWGSVLNRFVAQAMSGTPLTVHGGGTASTGLISLTDSVAALAHWIARPAAPGEHRVINQTTETRITVLEIAQLVQRIARERGIEVELSDVHDPRHERGRQSRKGPARNLRLRESGIPTISLEQGIRYLMSDLAAHRDGLGAASLLADVDWASGVPMAEANTAADSSADYPLTMSNSS
jgi:UDP-sulfoquinovose synthase